MEKKQPEDLKKQPAINSKRNFWRIVALLFVLGLISLFLFQFVFAEEKTVRKNCAGPEIEMFRTQLALIPNSDVSKRRSVEKKIQAWETMIAVCENIPPETGIPQVTRQFIPYTPPPFTTGIFEGQTGEIHAFEAKIENHWKGIVNGDRVIVFAGAWVKDPSQGFIAVRNWSQRSGQPSGGYFISPTKAGGLRIVGAKGSRLVIQQANDTKLLFFDVPALTYVNSLDEVVTPRAPTEVIPTAQPIITPYPYPYPAP
jgi:hypothetical protein